MNSEKTKREQYSEHKIGRTIYRVTNIFNGNIELKTALEDLTVKKVLQTAAPLMTA